MKTPKTPAVALRSVVLGLLGMAMILPGVSARAEDRAEPEPRELEGIGITEHLDARLPLNLEFTDENGKTVHLSDYFQGKRPVILNLVYFSCPMLCTLVLNGVTEGMKGIPWELSKDYENVTVSIDPSETPALAMGKKENYIGEYGHPERAAGWHFLTGRQPEITALADAVGFKYRFVPETREFIHTAGTFICTPDGRLSRYLYGIQYEPRTLRLALLEASEGKIGNTLDKLVLTCYHYDSAAGSYSLAALRVVRLGGLATALMLGAVIFGLILNGRRHKQPLIREGAAR